MNFILDQFSFPSTHETPPSLCVLNAGRAHSLTSLPPSPTQIVNPKGEMKGSAITGPVGKEAAELWPVCCPASFHLYPPIGKKNSSSLTTDSCLLAYREQFRCGDVNQSLYLNLREFYTTKSR